jgi:pyrimidine-nucleoside phosphorylase
MSKKIASGSNGTVLDVKVGHGAFMKTTQAARELAMLMVDIGRKTGRRVRAVISDMNQPLGCAVGNAVELQEAVDTLRGIGPTDFRQHCLTMASQILLLAGKNQSEQDARTELAALLDGGQALDKFREWISAQGGDTSFIKDPSLLPKAKFIRELPAPRSGYVAALDAREVGLTSMLLGGGRAKKSDPVDHAVGIVLQAKIGDRIEEGHPLFTIHANDGAKLSGAQQRLLAAFDWSEEPVSPPPLLHEIIG